jgi:hypothetical protein
MRTLATWLTLAEALAITVSIVALTFILFVVFWG